jgi:succinate dehydrogenase/fumarate reductase cytochrome b subunit
MITEIKLRNILVILICCTALIYFVAALQDSEELTESNSNSQKKLAVKLEYSLFVIVGIGYSIMPIWILVWNTKMIIPYSIINAGSIILIGIYLLAITIGVPIVGVEAESNLLATVSKMLQASIISITAILISSIESKKSISKRIKERKQCILCGRDITDEFASVRLRMPHGSTYIFDSANCLRYFQKLSSVYGDNLILMIQ